jgi:hypothetical protein
MGQPIAKSVCTERYKRINPKCKYPSRAGIQTVSAAIDWSVNLYFLDRAATLINLSYYCVFIYLFVYLIFHSS